MNTNEVRQTVKGEGDGHQYVFPGIWSSSVWSGISCDAHLQADGKKAPNSKAKKNNRRKPAIAEQVAFQGYGFDDTIQVDYDADLRPELSVQRDDLQAGHK